MEFGSPADWGLALAVMMTVLTMLITNKGLATTARLEEWKERYYDERKRADTSDAALRSNTNQLERMADILELSNKLRQRNDSE